MAKPKYGEEKQSGAQRVQRLRQRRTMKAVAGKIISANDHLLAVLPAKSKASRRPALRLHELLRASTQTLYEELLRSLEVYRESDSQVRADRFDWEVAVGAPSEWLERRGQIVEASVIRRDWLTGRERLALHAWRWEWLECREQIVAVWIAIFPLLDGQRAIPVYRDTPKLGPNEYRPDRFDGVWVEDLDGNGRVVSCASRVRDQFRTEHEYDAAGSHWHEAASLWALRKAVNRHGRVAELRLKDGSVKEFVTAWADGPPRTVSMWDAAALLASLGAEFARDRRNESAWWRKDGPCSLPIPGNCDLSRFERVWWWPNHYRLSGLERFGEGYPYRKPAIFFFATVPESCDWRHRPDPENSGVARRSREAKWDEAVALDPLRWSAIGEEPVGDEDIDDRKLAQPVDGVPAILEFFADGSFAVHRAGESHNHARMRGAAFPVASRTRANSGVVGYCQPSPAWAQALSPPSPQRADGLTAERKRVARFPLRRPSHFYCRQHWTVENGEMVLHEPRAREPISAWRRPRRRIWGRRFPLMHSPLPEHDGLDRLAMSAAFEA